ncbi:MAG TPA: hypothetical protein VKY90_21935, partial [Candidatus Dormibacteraeota bacterium]|nr:hypothetical protein [Candidatus Dormibacteraeota bacterium]
HLLRPGATFWKTILLVLADGFTCPSFASGERLTVAWVVCPAATPSPGSPRWSSRMAAGLTRWGRKQDLVLVNGPTLVSVALPHPGVGCRSRHRPSPTVTRSARSPPASLAQLARDPDRAWRTCRVEARGRLGERSAFTRLVGHVPGGAGARYPSAQALPLPRPEIHRMALQA